MKKFNHISDCVEYLENKYKVKFTKAYIGEKTNFKMYNKDWVIGEKSQDMKVGYRIDYDNKIGMHINFEGGKGCEYEHCLISTQVIKNEKFELWTGLHKKYKIPIPAIQKCFKVKVESV